MPRRVGGLIVHPAEGAVLVELGYNCLSDEIIDWDPNLTIKVSLEYAPGVDFMEKRLSANDGLLSMQEGPVTVLFEDLVDGQEYLAQSWSRTNENAPWVLGYTSFVTPGRAPRVSDLRENAIVLGFSPTGNVAVMSEYSGHMDMGEVFLFDIDTRDETRFETGFVVQSALWSSDGSEVLLFGPTGSGNDQVYNVSVYDVVAGVVSSYEPINAGAGTVAFAYDDGELQLVVPVDNEWWWNSARLNESDLVEVRELLGYEGIPHPDYIDWNTNSPSFSPDGRLLAYLAVEEQGSSTSVLRVEQAPSGELLGVFRDPNPASLMPLFSWSPDSEHIAVGEMKYNASCGNRANLWSVDTTSGVWTQLTGYLDQSSVEPTYGVNWAPASGLIAISGTLDYQGVLVQLIHLSEDLIDG